MTKFKFYGVRGTHNGEFLILCLNLNATPANNVPRSLRHILLVKRVGLIAAQFWTVMLLWDVLASIVVVAVSTP